MRISRAILLLVICFHTSSLWGQRVQVDWDRKADFGEYQTYAWEKGTDAPAKISHQRLVKAIEDQLGVRGIFKDEQEPDLFVIYHVAGKDEFQLAGGGRRDWSDSGAIEVQSFTQGTLVVDLVDAKENRLIWRGVASDTVSREPRKNATIIQRAVRKLFEKFPQQD